VRCEKSQWKGKEVGRGRKGGGEEEEEKGREG